MLWASELMLSRTPSSLHPAIGIRQIKSDGMGRSAAEKTASLSGMADDTSHIHVIGRSFIDESAAGVSQDGEIGMVHRTQDPLCLLLSRESPILAAQSCGFYALSQRSSDCLAYGRLNGILINRCSNTISSRKELRN
jgi:hypothetical protein